jgi:hypothetical protein
MSYAAHRKDFPASIAAPKSPEIPSARAGFWRRLYTAVSGSRRRRAEREIARFIQSRGGHLTDELERDLMRHLTSSPSYWGMHL